MDGQEKALLEIIIKGCGRMIQTPEDFAMREATKSMMAHYLEVYK